jgi:hypothetical protein
VLVLLVVCTGTRTRSRVEWLPSRPTTKRLCIQTTLQTLLLVQTGLVIFHMGKNVHERDMHATVDSMFINLTKRNGIDRSCRSFAGPIGKGRS